VIKSYFDSIGYEYRHEKFGIHYNTCAEGVNIFKDSSGWKARNSNGEAVKIVHYWGPFKPWSVGCPIFKELADDKMFNRDDVLGPARERQQDN
jgi:lipopolysaccharide biosynthesis glycosyltransferase